MSGGMFDYKQEVINDIIDEIKELLNKIYNKDEELYEYINDIPRFKKIVENCLTHLEMAYILTHRIDWFLSGDDGEENFYQRLKEDIDNLQTIESRTNDNLIKEKLKLMLAGKELISKRGDIAYWSAKDGKFKIKFKMTNFKTEDELKFEYLNTFSLKNNSLKG